MNTRHLIFRTTILCLMLAVSFSAEKVSAFNFKKALKKRFTKKKKDGVISKLKSDAQLVKMVNDMVASSADPQRADNAILNAMQPGSKVRESLDRLTSLGPDFWGGRKLNKGHNLKLLMASQQAGRLKVRYANAVKRQNTPPPVPPRRIPPRPQIPANRPSRAFAAVNTNYAAAVCGPVKTTNSPGMLITPGYTRLDSKLFKDTPKY